LTQVVDFMESRKTTPSSSLQGSINKDYCIQQISQLSPEDVSALAIEMHVNGLARGDTPEQNVALTRNPFMRPH